MPSDFTWADTPNDPTHPLADGSQEVLQFQASGAIDRIVVDLGTGEELCAYRDGAFRGSFAGRSSVDGSNNVQLYREGGWPAPPKVIPKVIPPVVETKVPALQPLNYSPRAAWALDSSLAGGQSADRMGTYTLTNTADSVPSSRLRGRAAWGSTFLQLASAGAQNPDFIFGSSGFTVAFCAYWRNSGNAQFMMGSTTGNAGYPNSWELWRNTSGDLEYRCGSNSGTAVSSGALPTVGPDWALYTLRRDAARSYVRLGINNSFATASVATPTPSLANGLIMLQSPSGGAWLGGLDNALIWPAELTDAQLIAQYQTALGV